MPDDTDPEPDSEATNDTDAALPPDVAEEAARLTRLARDAEERDPTSGPYEDETLDSQPPREADVYRDRRDQLLAHFDYVSRVREEREGGLTLVCYPEEWLDESGVVRLDAELDTTRAVEIPLSGPGEQGDFECAAAANNELVEAVREKYGGDHAANVRSFADFMSNHYARPAESASAAEVWEFLEHYYPRNAWPTDEQAAMVEESLRSAFEARDKGYPLD